jgi:feruloyl esterase
MRIEGRRARGEPLWKGNMSKRLGSFAVTGLAVLALALLAIVNPSPTTTDAHPGPLSLDAAGCLELASAAVPDTTITSSSVVPEAGALPEHCLVLGHITDSAINFALRLPTTEWNGNLYHEGGGGLVGYIPEGLRGLARGYAAVGTDTGHVGSPPVPLFDGAWALNNPEAQLDFGHRAVHLVTVSAKAVIAEAYGHGPRYSYFEGWSNGGRQGMMEAQRYPDDYDGIIAGSPVIDITNELIGHNHNQQTLLASPVPAAKLPALAAAVLAECDGQDGLVDGLVDLPGGCEFDPTVLTCPAGDAPDCLTAAQVDTVAKVYAGAMNSAHSRLHPGPLPGGEDGPTGWELWITGPGPFGVPLGFLVQDQTMRFFFFSDPSYEPMTFDFDTDVPAVEALAPILDATDPDLSEFRKSGGKLLMWHGLADPSVMPSGTLAYYDALVAEMGDDKLEKFFRLFFAPGMHHCFEGCGPGLNTFDALSAMEDWVERGEAPEELDASHTGPGIARTRPLCAYPKVAVYLGERDINDGENFRCKRHQR